MSELIKKMSAWGCETVNTLERMVEDEELYAECMTMFATDKSFSQLSQAVLADEYEAAFEHAHALKGVIENLGLTPLQAPISQMTEILRAKIRQTAQQQQASKAQTHQQLLQLCQEVCQKQKEFAALVQK